eukprot:TRINITY_DN4843_c1_g1_i1.p2 TRINITY_DN4843_c1_g1~~TRINITY_DN4843_c1_g1_i1.p2  ORF type:complete len:118 (+),score=3.98 TRINITY_DN4843_c1_g1_i1:107-460(+)
MFLLLSLVVLTIQLTQISGVRNICPGCDCCAYTSDCSDCCSIFEAVLNCPVTVENVICLQPSDIGPCFAAMPRYYFNPQSQTCEIFIYGGCLGNSNNFITKEECEAACISDEIDEEP